ncbi:MAG: hypothetical protein JXA95_10880 [Spirochaetales bacterium]|nr:hypothetical protein [Spirochaetales bacterium]
MAIRIVYSDGGTGTVVSGSGVVSSGEYLAFCREHLSGKRKSLYEYKYNLTDWSDVDTAEITSGDIADVARLSRQAAELSPGCIVAIVAGKDFLFGLSRMWENQSVTPDSTVLVFRDRSEAENWIRRKLLSLYGQTDISFR